MDVSERERRDAIASELADLPHRQATIVVCNKHMQRFGWEENDERLRLLLKQDEENLQIIENVVSRFGRRMAARDVAVGLCDLLKKTMRDQHVSLLDQLSLYRFMKRQQIHSCRLLRKAARRSYADVKIALAPLDLFYSVARKQSADFRPLAESWALEWMIGDGSTSRGLERLRQSLSRAAERILGKSPTSGLRMEDSDIIDLLAGEHRKLELLIDEIEAAEDFDDARSLFLQLRTDLLAHTTAEEDYVYMPFTVFLDARKPFAHAFEEHDALKRVLEQITAIRDDETLFSIKIDELKALVYQHKIAEESELFDLIRRHSDESQRMQLTREYLAGKRGVQISLVGSEETLTRAEILSDASQHNSAHV